jgi:chemotaxis signal transduction protein
VTAAKTSNTAESVDPPGARFVCATAGVHHLAFPIAAVQEVLAPRTITRLFHAPPSLLGVVNLRGEILPVVDLVLLLGEPSAAASTRAAFSDEARLIVLRAQVENRHGGQRAQAKPSSIAVLVAHLDPLRDGVIEALPAGVPEAVSRIALGIVPSDPSARTVVVIDPDKLIEVDELASMRA